MLRKRQKQGLFDILKSNWKKLAGLAVAAEFASLAFMYYGYRRINHDPELRYRLYVHKYGYQMLKYYYFVGNTMNKDLQIRHHDVALWIREGKPIRREDVPN